MNNIVLVETLSASFPSSRMTQNLGKLDRVLRFALAVWFLGPWAPQFDIELVNWLVFGVGVIALLESFIGWCWLHTAFGINNKNQ